LSGIYREEGLWLDRTRYGKILREGRDGARYTITPDRCQSLDFTQDAMANGVRLRTASLKDDYKQEYPAIEMHLSPPGERVVGMLNRVVREQECPDIPVVDNGPQLRGRAFDGWVDDHGSNLVPSIPANRPGTPASRVPTGASAKNA